MKIESFGTLPDGRDVHAYTLEGSHGASLQLLNYGGIVTRLLAPDRNGALADVVLGFDTLEEYRQPQPYFGATVGRVAGRIPNGCIHVNGVTHRLPLNDGSNHLHGGGSGFHQRLWKAEPIPGQEAVRLTLQSPDGDEGYPANLDVSVTMTFTKENAFVIETEAASDALTPVSLTHHSYFNLGGSGTIADHQLTIHADEQAAVDQAMSLLGTRQPVTAANDFRSQRWLKEAVPQLFQEHGDLYFLNQPGLHSPKTAATLFHPASGRLLQVRTTESCLQLYCGKAVGPALHGKAGRIYDSFAGLCLECEGFPAAATFPGFDDILARPGMPRRQTTIYAFSTQSS
jgi:aldose 1-epimerase